MSTVNLVLLMNDDLLVLKREWPRDLNLIHVERPLVTKERSHRSNYLNIDLITCKIF